MAGISKFENIGPSASKVVAHPAQAALFWPTFEDFALNMEEAKEAGCGDKLAPCDVLQFDSVRALGQNVQKHFLLMLNRRYPKLVCTVPNTECNCVNTV